MTTDNSDKKSMTVSLYLKYDTDLDIIEAVKKQKNSSDFVRQCIRAYLTGEHETKESDVIKRLKAIEKKIDKLKGVVAITQNETEKETSDEIKQLEDFLVNEAFK